MLEDDMAPYKQFQLPGSEPQHIKVPYGLATGMRSQLT